MKISDEGLRLIKSFEGYHTQLPDGSCTAYQTYLGKNALGRKKYDIPTIGYGCTAGVKMGMVWTEAEAEAALRRELAKFEDTVARLVTVSINQNERDALISFTYNLGEANLRKSTLLKKLNRGDRAGAAKEFTKWTRAQGIRLDGLVARRMREAALFLKPVEKPEEPFMAQSVEKEPSKAEITAKLVAGTAAVAAVDSATTGTLVQLLPSIPAPPVEAVSNVAGWQNAAETLVLFAKSPSVAIAICGILIAAVAPVIARRFA